MGLKTIALAAVLAVVGSTASAEDVVYVNDECANPVETGALCKFYFTDTIFNEDASVEDLNPEITEYISSDGTLPRMHVFKVGTRPT